MAIVQLKSTNPKLSFLIKRNPESGVMLRSVRKGLAYGWYDGDLTYNVYFKDADNEVSYKQHERENFEYLNVSRYNTPLFPLSAINEFFSAPFKARDERDEEGYEHTFFINMIHIEMVRYIESFAQHLKDFRFDLTHLAHKSYSLTITTRKSLYELLHVVGVTCLFLSMFGNEYIDISDSILDKYIRSIQIIDAPFYIRSLFARNFLSSRERFKAYKGELEKTDRCRIALEFGGTAMQRRSFIKERLLFDKPVLDVGCGEGYYAMPFASKSEHSYYAIDINEELLVSLNHKAAAKELDNIVTFPSIDRFLDQYNGERVDVILTEVIEHMGEAEAQALIVRICRQIDFDSFIITTPNADFNPHYELAGFRHDDHRWEMGESEFRAWLSDSVQAEAVELEFVAIGDSVDGIHTTQGVIVRKKER